MVVPGKILLVCLVLLAMDATGASAEGSSHTIRWMLTGVPPKLVPDGPLRGAGYGEQQVALLTRRLPQFDHHLESVTPARLWHEMRSGQDVCSIDIADVPEREQWAIFTRHQTSIPGYRLLVLKEKLPAFAEFRDAAGRIDLDRLAANDQLRGIYVAGRHYMPQINAFLDNPKRKVGVEAMSASTKIFEMVADRRGDFSFANVTEMNYFNALNAAIRTGAKAWPPLAMLVIKGGDDQVHGHIACSRGVFGKQVIQAVDHLLDDEATWTEFMAPERRWLDDVPAAGN
jgi:uncharacterized protein (TIGR02285 family)